MVPDLETSGMNTFLLPFVPTAIPRMRQLAKSHRFSFLGWTAVPPQKQPCCQHLPWNQLIYRMMLPLSSARNLAAKSIHQAQQNYKTQYDRKATHHHYRIGDWVLTRFPHEESGKQRKLSRPCQGPYRVVSCIDPDVTVVSVYFPLENQIQVHQFRVRPCPPEFPAGYY